MLAIELKKNRIPDSFVRSWLEELIRAIIALCGTSTKVWDRRNRKRNTIISTGLTCSDQSGTAKSPTKHSPQSGDPSRRNGPYFPQRVRTVSAKYPIQGSSSASHTIAHTIIIPAVAGSKPVISVRKKRKENSMVFQRVFLPKLPREYPSACDVLRRRIDRSETII